MESKETAERKEVREQLLGALIGLGRAAEGNKNRPTSKTNEILIGGLQMVISNHNDSDFMLEEQIRKIHEEKNALVPRCLTCSKQCGRNNDYTLKELIADEPELLEKKMIILSDILMLSEIFIEVQSNSKEDIFLLIYDALYLLGKKCTLIELEHTAELVNRTFQKVFVQYLFNEPIGKSV